MSSGSYFPPAVKAVPIPKKTGGERILGVPTVSDRIAQTVVTLLQTRTDFTPAVSRTDMPAMRQAMRRWHLPLRSELSLGDLARMTAPRVRGWIRYYCRFRGSEFQPVAEYIDRVIVRWAMRKYKRLRGHKIRAFAWLDRVKRRYPGLFVHWCARGAFSVEAMGAR
ncbi:group II intron maturase-specific domain-containing protein [Haliea sp. E1-2-M8]|uniref:group II intron maturase-specific domain-containing protein n=1 Tax=Haliea sp. E1-2-M8 TaxID=3064706 RepID=UPI00351C9AC7